MRSKLSENRLERANFIIPITVLWGFAALVVFAFVWLENDFGSLMEGFYLLPWALLTGIFVLAPSAYLIYKGKFDFFHPLVFAAWSYLFPAFIVGSVIVAFGWVNPYFLIFIEDPQYNLPLALVYVSSGFIGLTGGFFLPVGKFMADKIEPLLPKWDWQPRQVWLPGLLLLLCGVGFNILAFIQGLLGYQKNIEVNMFDGLLFFLTPVLTMGTVLLWLAIFSTNERNGIFYLMLILLLLFFPLRMAVFGSRSSLFSGLLPIAMAFVYSGRRLKWQTVTAFASVGLIAVFIGVVYGTTFRTLKGSEARIEAGDYFKQVVATLDYLSSEDSIIIFEKGAQDLADRIENLSSLGVVVANYEKLAPFEAGYGLENNIVNDLYTSFIPRFLWNDKPPTSDARAYSDLYFNYGDNSFTITPFGDLLRNFGPIGIPLGMLLLGICLRFIYTSLIDTPHPAMWKKVAYFPLLTVVSYEAFYATIFPSLVRTVFVAAVSLLLVNLLIKNKTKRG